jgi:hypothetical protein
MTRDEGLAVHQAWNAALDAVESAEGSIRVELEKLSDLARMGGCRQSDPLGYKVECSIHRVQGQLESLRNELEAAHQHLLAILRPVLHQDPVRMR